MTTISTMHSPSMHLSAPDNMSTERVGEETTPTTPRPNARFHTHSPRERSSDNPLTPTKHDFGGIPGQRALPSTPFTPARLSESHTPGPLDRGNSHRSTHSHNSADSQDMDVEMADDDDEEDGDDSDNDSVSSDTQRPRKKKKGQRFFCTDFPPCQLSFTRSEHLARHIRKHTGERPFQCHCSRRFSRLDNLRQHAQTVHVNEEIPGDSLAATGTRFQRQIRTDRVRPPNNRSRASTATSQGGHSRGHSRNLSASSIASTASNASIPDEPRRRPAPLAMAQDNSPRSRLTIDTFVPPPGQSAPASQPYGYYQPQSPSGYTTPTSATFSTGASSPRFASGMQSPSSISRSSFYNGTRAPAARRLSVPSVASPYQPGSTYPLAYYSPMQAGGAPALSNAGSLLTSPTGSVFSHSRGDSDAELEWRRRTWHPGTYASYVNRPATSGLSYHQTPDDSRPTLASQPAAASQVTRLPGIESFDHLPPLPPAGPLHGHSHGHARHQSTPMHIDAGRLSFHPPPMPQVAGPSERRNSGVETGLRQGLNRLDIANATPPKQSQNYMEHAAPSHPPPPPPSFALPAIPAAQQPPPTTDARTRRQAWYGGPVIPSQGSQPIMIAHRKSPEDSGSSDGVPTPGTSQGTELHPAILHSNGTIEMQQGAPGTVLSGGEDQHQKVVQFQSENKPEPTRADSGFQSHHGSLPSGVPGMQFAPNGLQDYRSLAPPPSMLPQLPLPPTAQTAVAAGGPPAPAGTRSSNDMGRLEALVAVATSENRAVEQQQ